MPTSLWTDAHRDFCLTSCHSGQKDYWWPDATCRPQHIVQGPPSPLRPVGVSILDNLLEWGADLSWSIATGCRLHQYRWGLIAAGWLWTMLAVAWFTGLVRKE